ncbi:hypothetical protein DXO200_03160 [Xanthomonas oryzae pv. oryzae]|nr:hypothetical protein BXO471_04075 [Xanthomonas oryzae pv. oryzae]OLH18485.1 hypothetical protein DXO015_03365 [Xanthomonas oryzae pv. oryzae]OLH58788.1 hypothetical protein DXO150_07100 [Xanthomonas oryzae pv. oryzae]OLH71756.1 hypothetical protein DXO200_03160 [Xanthomonas oryzae pv. oryzae]OLH78532.1 hypothetical protein DXO203_12305 [Xanthomonas oryzae pv. oryzae]
MAAQAFNAIGQTLWFSLALGNFIARAVSRVKCNTSRDLLLAQLMDGQPSRPLIVQKLREPVF